MKKILLFIILILLFIFGISGIYLEFKEYNDGAEEYYELEQFVNAEINNEIIEVSTDNKVPNELKSISAEATVDFSGLKAVNSDCVAWIHIPDTNVNYPVVKGIDNNYYVTHTFKKRVNKSGTIFIDMRNSIDFSDKNTIIYGHNLKNNKMFSELKNFLNKNYFDNHKQMIIYTENAKMLYEAFAVCKIMKDSDIYNVNFSNNDEFYNHIEKIVNSSIVGVKANKDEINQINSNIDKMYLDKLNNKISEEMYDRLLKRLEKQIANKENKYIEIRKMKNDTGEDDGLAISKLVKEFLKLDKPTSELLRVIVNRIEIHQDKQVDIVFNFKKLNNLISS